MGKIDELVGELIRIKQVADARSPTFACQGQAMDGYAELASYRAIIEQLEQEAKKGNSDETGNNLRAF